MENSFSACSLKKQREKRMNQIKRKSENVFG
jgi:hypothetical protein